VADKYVCLKRILQAFTMDWVKKYSILFIILFAASAFIEPALCFLLLGAFIAYWGFSTISYQKRLSNTGIDVEGKIVGYKSDRDGDKTPVIEFLSLQGDIIKGTPFVYLSTYLNKTEARNNPIDLPVPVLYDPADPEKFILRNEKGFNTVIFVMFIVVGLAFIGVGLGSLLGYIKLGKA
jgi:hypothetical protein